jgi:hypothetical protein
VRAVATVDIAELAFEIDFLASHYAVADDGKPPGRRRPNNDLSGICRVIYCPHDLVYVTFQTSRPH